MTGWDVLVRELALAGSWQLGGGGSGIFYPPAPTRLDRPGFLDAAYYAGQVVEPVFAISVLDDRQRPLPLVANSRRWNPARLELSYSLPQALISERRAILSNDAFVSQLTLTHAEESSRDFWFVLWTRRAIASGQSIAEIDANPQGLSFTETVAGADGRMDRWSCALGTNFDAESWTVDHTPYPGLDLDWRSTPLVDLMTASGLPGHFPAEPKDGWLWLALAYPFTVAPGDRLKVSFVAALGPDVENVRGNLEQAVSLIDPIHTSEEEWIAWFEECPSLECSDALLQRAYWHRWAEHRIWRRSRRPSDAIVRGADAVVEAAWRHDPDEATADAREIVARMPETSREPLGISLRRIASVHPNADLLSDIVANGRLLALERMPSIDPSPRSLALALDLLQSIETISSTRECVEVQELASELRTELIQRHWCDVAGWFVESQPGQSPVKTLEGVLPLLDPECESDVRQRIEEKLIDPEFFGDAPGLPGVSRDETRYRPDNWQSGGDAWRAGRVCPSLFSLAIEALGRNIEQADAQGRALLAKLVRDHARLPFGDGVLALPMDFDHYHPLGGRGSNYLGPAPPKGWLADHLIQFAAGLRPRPGGLVVVDPLPFGLEWFRLERVTIGEYELDIRWDNRGGLSVWLDGKVVGNAPVGRSLILDIQTGNPNTARRDARIA